MPSVLSMLALVGAVAVAPAVADFTTKPSVFGSTEAAKQETDLLKDLPSHTLRSEAWDPAWIPQYCYNEAKTYNLNPADFEVRNVFYTDCGAAWAICRHTSASKDWNTIIDLVGRVPVGMRQYISNLLVFPDSLTNSNGICAYTWGGSWLASSYAPGCLTLGVLSHETSHILDVAALTDVIAADGLPAGTGYSSTAHWQGAFNKDPSVITDYARASWAEDFADTGRYAVSDLVHPGVLASYNSKVSQVANQLGNYKSRLGSIIISSSGQCTGKIVTSQAVQVSTGQPGKRGMRGGARSLPPSPPLGSVPELPKPANASDVQYIYAGALPY